MEAGQPADVCPTAAKPWEKLKGWPAANPPQLRDHNSESQEDHQGMKRSLNDRLLRLLGELHKPAFSIEGLWIFLPLDC